MRGYLKTEAEKECFGCEACVQACPKDAIQMQENAEGFRYPRIDESVCVHCGLCNIACPYEQMPQRYHEAQYAFGGYHLDEQTRFESTSGGAFSAIVEAYCDENYVIFGAKAKGLDVFHSYIVDKKDLEAFRKSKYSQSVIGNSYNKVKRFLKEGKKVLFSGTPCQIAGLRAFLKETNQDRLLTVEVVCEGVPTPLYVRKMEQKLEQKHGSKIESLDYRYTGRSLFSNGKWDFQIMKIGFRNKSKAMKIDRWFNPFWPVWLEHLMSRPSCYECPFATKERVADITLGDLWGVHLYCPELYGKNGGSSLIVANSEKGKNVLLKAQSRMYGHELRFEDALKYQSPMRKSIDSNPKRDEFMKDIASDMSFDEINKKWAASPTLKLLWQKYIWGNRQKIFVWNLKKKFGRKA